LVKHCAECGKELGLKARRGWIEQSDDTVICYECNEKKEAIIADETENIIVTTTLNVDGYKVTKYIDIESVELVIGTGIFSEFSASFSDMVGGRASAFEEKLSKAKRTALEVIKRRAYEKNGNAVIGIDIDYMIFSGNKIGVTINGTVVKIEKIS
jgi:uncharacterized protein YbjQ (UPF0145 family)